MNISVLIICRELNDVSEVLKQLSEFDSSKINLEIIVGEGDNPSEQRNRLAEISSSEWILFLDDDSKPAADFFETYCKLIETHSDMVISGGPSVLLEEKSVLSRLSLCFFTSSFGIGPFKSRYMPFGKTRRASEKDLISCNLLVKRDFFLSIGGFHKELHPNEENEFLKKSKEAKIYYEPDAIVYRKPRSTFLKFLWQMYRYGEGRAKHIHFRNSKTDFLFLLPPFFLVYIFCTIFLYQKIGFIVFVPLLIHAILTIGSALKSRGATLLEKIFFMPMFNVFAHGTYGLGLLIGGVKYFVIKSFFYKERTLKYFKAHTIKSL